MAETILVLEDTETNRLIVAKLLQKLGYDVLMAANGEEGFKCIERCEAEKRNLVAILTDMYMPLVDGPDFVSRLRDEPRYEELPVIFMTSATDKDSIFKAKKLNASGYILKPVDLQKLVDQLQEIFPQRKFA